MSSSEDDSYGPPAVPKKANPHRGKASIDKMLAKADDNRRSSKRTFQELEFGNGSPSTRNAQQLWANRIDRYRQDTLKENLDTPFTGKTIVRFLQALIPEMRWLHKNPDGTPMPITVRVVNLGVGYLVDYGTFRYPPSSGFRITAHDKVRIKTYISDCVDAGTLTHGKQQERVWLNYVHISYMNRKWLECHKTKGTTNWDRVIAKTLSVVLTNSVAARAGDLARTSCYNGVEYLKWEDVRLKLKNDVPHIHNVSGQLILKYCKNEKDKKNMNQIKPIFPVTSSLEEHMCPISWLIIHALRHGLVRGNDIDEVLQQAIDSIDKHVIWLFPQRPVLAAFDQYSPHVIHLDKAAGIGQSLHNIKEMGAIANVVGRVYTHAMRSGAAQDYAHLPEIQGKGFVNNAVRQALSHTNKSFSAGCTEMYAGAPTADMYNLRIENQFLSEFGTQFAADSSDYKHVKRRLTSKEIDAWQAKHQSDLTSEERDSVQARRRASWALSREKKAEHVANAPRVDIQEARSSRQPLTTMPTNRPVLRKGKSISSIVPVNFASADMESAYMTMNENDKEVRKTSKLDLLAAIDPRLLNEPINPEIEERQTTKDEIPVGQVLVESPIANESDSDSYLLLNGDDSANDEFLAAQFFAQCDAAGNAQSIDQHDVIKFFARINIVATQNFFLQLAKFEAGGTFEETIGCTSNKGNSRDFPTPFVYSCRKTPGCPFNTLSEVKLLNHERFSCSNEYVASAAADSTMDRIPCPDCDRTFKDQTTLNVHKKSTHEFEPRPCEHGCDPDTIYSVKHRYDYHIKKQHTDGDGWPTKCLVPECTSDDIFQHVASYKLHLTTGHELITKASRASYYPSVERKRKQNETRLVKAWAGLRCPLDECKNRLTIDKSKGHFIRHIKTKHKLTRDEAHALAEDGIKLLLISETLHKKGEYFAKDFRTSMDTGGN